MSRPAAHLSDEMIAAYLEGGLAENERPGVERHLGTCPACLRHLAETRTLLSAAGLLPPPLLYHPVERLLSRLQRWIPLPVLGWHALLETFTYLLLAATVGWAGPPLPWHSSPGKTLSIGLVILVATTHFLWLQPRLRALVRDLWRAGAPPEGVQRLNRRIAWLQGWPLGGLWLFAAMFVPNNALNLLGARPVTWEYAKETIIDPYEGLALMALLWGACWGGFVWHAIARALGERPQLRVASVVERARRLALGWTALGSVGATAFLYVNLRNAVPPALLVWWVGAIVALLLLLWGGYAHLEYRLSKSGERAAWSHGAPALRLMITLALALAPFLVVLAS